MTPEHAYPPSGAASAPGWIRRETPMPSRTVLRDHWRLESSALVGTDGAAITAPGYEVSSWHETVAPRTVLCALVKDGTYPDPRYWPNPLRLPDSSDEFNVKHDLARYSHLPEGRNPWRDPWWYRTEVRLPALGPGERVWLTIGSLNYRAAVWVNGRRVAGPEQLVGMFRRFRLDVTDFVVAGTNLVAILVYPVDHCGEPDTQLEVYGPVRGFHKDICNDVTEVMSVGYDCFPTVPDRNLGLIQEVALEVTGPVDIRDPFVRADLDLPELDPARLTVSAELVNAAATPVSGVLEGTVYCPDGCTVASFSCPTVLLGHETRLIAITPTDAPALALDAPQLWWPNTYGEQPIYSLRLRFRQEEGTSGPAISSEVRTSFGLRRIDRELHQLDGAHGFRLLVNGRRVFQRGGYVQPEMMFDWDETRVAAELRYLKEANLNYVVFEDIPNPPDWYLDLCDRYGLMLWNCYYDCYWLQYNRPWDVDLQVLEDCTMDITRRYRNHPCLVIYMAQNEGETREDVYELWRRTVLGLDDTRFLVPSGSFPDYRTGVPAWFARELPVGMNDYMPKTYSWQLPWVYYKLVREDRNWMFMIESASASVPPLESLVEFLPQVRELSPSDGSSAVYPLDEAWAHFGANSYYEWFDRGLRLLYGEPRDVRDYVWKAHLVAYDQHRGFFEAVHHRMWEITSGFGEWKINSAFPDVQWQLYDWFLRPLPSLFAIRKACAPLAVQLCPLDGMVSLVNNTEQPRERLQVTARVYGQDLQVLHEQTAVAGVGANTYAEVFTLPRPADADRTPIYFVKLQAAETGGRLLADNFYWLSPRLEDYEIVYQGDMHAFPANKPLAVPRQAPCLPELAELPPLQLEVQATAADDGVLVEVDNTAGGLAFFIRLRLTSGAEGREVLPAYYSDNYFSLLPGENKQVTVQTQGAWPEDLAVCVDGWNIVPQAAPVGRG